LPAASPVILPYRPNASLRESRETKATSEERGAKSEEPSGPCLTAERFAFPALPQLPEVDLLAESSAVAWPKCNDAEVARACATMADGILHLFSLERSRVVLFTSPSDGDGKTSVLVALAPQLARRIEGSILVADANPRKPDLTSRLSLPAAEASSRSVLIYPTNLPHLSVLPVRRPVVPEFQGFDRSWLDELREAWPLVLLDAASLAHPEVAPMASCCDGVFLVVRLGYTPQRAVAEAARVIRGSGGRLLGCVVVN
jgi:Mrp family chromosome partitioning ATPase